MQQAQTLPSRLRRANPVPAESHSIGRASRWLKRRHLLGRIWRTLLGVAAVIAGAMLLGWAVGGITLTGLLLTALAALLAAALLLRYPRLMVPPRGELARGPLETVIARTELWLESRQAALPPRAASLLEPLALRLDDLALQLHRLDEQSGAGEDLRWLVGEHIPRLVLALDGFADGDPSGEQVIAALVRAAGDLARIARNLAIGTLDDLPLKAQRLDSL